MAEFGLFDPEKSEPIEVWQGDRMHLEKGYVTIFKTNPDPQVRDIEVIDIRLKVGFSVRKLGNY